MEIILLLSERKCLIAFSIAYYGHDDFIKYTIFAESWVLWGADSDYVAATSCSMQYVYEHTHTPHA